MIFQPHMLDFWSSFDPTKGFELKDMVWCPNPLPLTSPRKVHVTSFQEYCSCMDCTEELFFKTMCALQSHSSRG